jgi:hypothetical protein
MTRYTENELIGAAGIEMGLRAEIESITEVHAMTKILYEVICSILVKKELITEEEIKQFTDEEWELI